MISIEQMNKEFFNIKNWFYPKRIKLETSTPFSLAIKSRSNKKNYVTFLENNKSFNSISSENNKIELNSDIYTIEISGKYKDNISTIIYLLEYNSDNVQIGKRTIPLNKRILYKKKFEAIYARLAISVEGKGELIIEDVFFAPFAPIITNLSKAIDSTNYMMGTILSDYNSLGFKQYLNTFQIKQVDWERQLLTKKPNAILIEVSSPNRIGEWNFTSDLESNTELIRLLLWCKLNNIKTILWDTCGNNFLNNLPLIVKLSDIILTVDFASIQKYQVMYQKEQIYHMMYAANTGNINNQRIIKVFTEQRVPLNFEQYNLNDNILLQQEILEESKIVPQIWYKEIGSVVPIASKNLKAINKYFGDIVPTFANELELDHLLKELSDDDKLFNEYLLKFNREIFYFHSFRQRSRFLLKLLTDEWKEPSISIVFHIKTKEGFFQAYRLWDSQKKSDIRCILLVDIFEEYDELFEQYNSEEIKIYLSDYVYTHYNISELIETDYFIFVNEEDLNNNYDQYLVEDILVNFHYKQPIFANLPSLYETKLFKNVSFNDWGRSSEKTESVACNPRE